MQVCNISNNQTFTAKTKRGKTYNETNTGKFLGLGLGLGIIAEKIISKGSFAGFTKDYYDDLAKAIGEDATKSQGKKVEIKELTTPLLKKMAKANLAGSIAILMASCFVAGTVLDWLVNSFRRGKADGEYV